MCWLELTCIYTLTGQPYAALEMGDECHCGLTYKKYGSSNKCSKKCSGNSQQTCGGNLAFSVYSTFTREYNSGCRRLAWPPCSPNRIKRFVTRFNTMSRLEVINEHWNENFMKFRSIPIKTALKIQITSRNRRFFARQKFDAYMWYLQTGHTCGCTPLFCL